MVIAIPYCQGRVSPVFDVATRLLTVHLRGQTELERREVVLCEKHSDGIVRGLQEWGVQLLICGGISQPLQRQLERAGLRVRSHICGDIDAVLQAYLDGRLSTREFLMPGCCRRFWRHPHPRRNVIRHPGPTQSARGPRKTVVSLSTKSAPQPKAP